MKDCLGNPLREGQMVQVRLNNGQVLIGRIEAIDEARVLASRPGGKGTEPRPGVCSVKVMMPCNSDPVSNVCAAVTRVVDPAENVPQQ